MRRLLCVFLLLLLVGCTSQQSEPIVEGKTSSAKQNTTAQTTPKTATATSSTTVRTTIVTTTEVQEIPEEEKILKQMTLEEKVGQLLILPVSEPKLSDAQCAFYETIHPGGYIFFPGAIQSTGQIRELNTALYKITSIPPFLSVDQEGGRVQRVKSIDDHTVSIIPSMRKIGKQGDCALAFDVGTVLGSELRVFGFNMDFAPCADVFSNPENKVIGDRAFSSDPKLTAELSTAMADGLIETGVIPVCKHFPGHGDTYADSHDGYAASGKTLDELYATELIPFIAHIENDTPAIMAAHISLPNILDNTAPCTMSNTIITGLLREELGYDGVVITDAMNMGAIANTYSSSEAAVTALLAGCDMILMPEDTQSAYDAIIEAIKNGTISEARIDESILRILRLKLQFEIFAPLTFQDTSVLNCDAHKIILSQFN